MPSNTVVNSVMAEQAHLNLMGHSGRQVKTQYCSWRMRACHHLKLLMLTLYRTNNKYTGMTWMRHAKKEHATSLMLKEIW